MKDTLMSSRRPASSLKGPYMMKVDFGPQKSNSVNMFHACSIFS